MRKLTLKIEKETINGKQTFFTTVGILKMAINSIPHGGSINIQEMGKRLRLMNILSNYDEFDVEEDKFQEYMTQLTKTIDLEDADFHKLKELFNETKWTIVSKFIFELGVELNN